ncbi:MAG TPA: glutamate 5-kinase [Terrimicrobiaceae bacterium]|nr:glutamate 5-kinase [Terrimicrobiaceae bacterium]
MRRIVLKFGTGTLSRSAGRALHQSVFRRIAGEISQLINAGDSCVIVSSAAIAAGVHMLKRDSRPEDLPAKQACAAVGQPELMRMYAAAFRRHGLMVAQLLLTHDDIDSRMRRQNAFNTIERILDAGNIVPIINENDTVAVEELRLGDNDRLSAEVAQLVNADILLLLTSSDGLSDSNGRRIPVAGSVSEVLQHVRPDKGELSVGGMRSKLQAVDFAISHGIPACILDGRKPGQIAAALNGRNVGTRFSVPGKGRFRKQIRIRTPS